jgi:hypothetical protein
MIENNDINTAMMAVLEKMKTCYKSWMKEDWMVENYCNNLKYTVGKKYIKIVNNGSAAGFIVNIESDKKFKRGDLLKAASWNAPARNFSRGNIFTDNIADIKSIKWTGVS